MNLLHEDNLLTSEEPKHAAIAHPIHRVRTGKPTKGICTSVEYFGLYVHFTGQSGTHPCLKEHCPSCRHGSTRRWKAYCSFLMKDSQHVILEMTERLGPQLKGYKLQHNGSLRGTAMELWRNGTKSNSPLMCSMEPVNPKRFDLETLPEGLDVVATLLNMWRGNTLLAAELPGAEERELRPIENAAPIGDLLARTLPAR